MKILDIVKTLLGIKDSSQDNILALCIGMVTQQILNYTNRAELPDELIYVAAQMVIEVYNETFKSSETVNVASVSEAGRTVSFNTALVQLAAENKLEERKAQLNGFRLPYRTIAKRE